MIMKKLLFLIILFLLVGVHSTAAQQPSETETAARRTEVKKLDKLVGHWKGAGWIMHGRERTNFVGTENVQRKLDGLALMFEGRFTAKIPATGEDKVMHETIGVLTFNPQSKIYDFNTFLANGMSGKYDFKTVEGGWEWGFKFSQGTMRYLIKIENDTWTETGEMMLTNGKEWMKFFEMTLKKVN